MEYKYNAKSPNKISKELVIEFMQEVQDVKTAKICASKCVSYCLQVLRFAQQQVDFKPLRKPQLDLNKLFDMIDFYILVSDEIDKQKVSSPKYYISKRVNKFPKVLGYISITDKQLTKKLGVPYYADNNKFWEIEYSTGEVVKIFDYDVRTKLWKVGSKHYAGLEKIKTTFPDNQVIEKVKK